MLVGPELLQMLKHHLLAFIRGEGTRRPTYYISIHISISTYLDTVPAEFDGFGAAFYSTVFTVQINKYMQSVM